MTPVQILKAARTRIEKPENWGKGLRPIERPMDTCCAAEAIEEAPGETRDDSERQWASQREAARILYLAAGLDFGAAALVNWNDVPERTHAEVLATFSLAIALARNFPRGA